MKKYIFIFVIFFFSLFLMSCKKNSLPEDEKEQEIIIPNEVDDTKEQEPDNTNNEPHQEDPIVDPEPVDEPIDAETHIFLYHYMLIGLNDEVVTEFDVYSDSELTSITPDEIEGYILTRIDTEEKLIDGVTYHIDKAIYVLDTHEIDEVADFLTTKYNEIFVSSDIELITEYNDAKIVWASSNPLRLNKEGKYTINYQTVVVTLTAMITLKEQKKSIELCVTVKGYKELKNIVGGYIYRNFDKVTDTFFEVNDIVYCCFLTFNEDASINNPIKSKMLNYIIPKCKENGIYVLASFNKAETFSKISADDALRKKAAQNLVNLINELGLDGIDFDWETPKSSESKNFTLLCKEVYTAIKANNPNHLLTAAVASGKWSSGRFDIENSINYLDYINIMTYSMVSNGGYYHTALYRNTSTLDKTHKVGRTMDSCSIAESAKIYQDKGVPNNKMIWGAAFYGVKQVYENGSWVSKGSILYNNLINNYLNNPNYTKYYDERCEEPYLLSNDGTTFVSYDDERSLIAKCKYSMEEGMAGVMYWEWGCDYLTNELLLAIKEGFNK